MLWRMRLTTRHDVRKWIAEDARANGVTRLSLSAIVQKPTVRFLLWLRIAEYLTNTGRGPLRFAGGLARLGLLRCSVRLGFSIPLNVCGPGLALPHWGTIVISSHARIGERARIHVGVNVGGTPKRAPLIGADCYLGPGAKLFGAVELGDGCIVGANAVVTKSFPTRTVIGGVPARALRIRRPGDRPDEADASGT